VRQKRPFSAWKGGNSFVTRQAQNSPMGTIASLQAFQSYNVLVLIRNLITLVSSCSDTMFALQ
jgi:hypothetical protein